MMLCFFIAVSLRGCVLSDLVDRSLLQAVCALVQFWPHLDFAGQNPAPFSAALRAYSAGVPYGWYPLAAEQITSRRSTHDGIAVEAELLFAGAPHGRHW